MSVTINHIVFDCCDPRLLAQFWAAALGWEANLMEADHTLVYRPSGERPILVFNRVAEEKSIKNRMHLDLGPDDADTYVERLVALGARKLRFVDTGDDSWWIMADPEGNEFCV
jgi:hypothetical protein